MDITGRLKESQGWFTVGEIAPISEPGNLVTNGDFSAWTDDDPDNWVVNYESGSDPLVTETEDGCRIYSSGGNVQITQENIMTVGKYYKIIIEISDASHGGLYVGTAATVAGLVNSVGIWTFYIECDNDDLRIKRQSGLTDVTIKKVILEEVPEGAPIMKQGDKYLECTLDGRVSFPSKVAYGEWEFSFQVNDNFQVDFISLNPEDYPAHNGYSFYEAAGTLYLDRDGTGLMVTDSNYISDAVWYRVKITRSLDGEFTLYIKGGSFGEEWTLVSTSGGSGTNPVTDNTYKKSEYFGLNMDYDVKGAGDKIANISIKNQIRQ